MESARDALPLHYTRLTLTDKELRSFFIAYASDEIGWDRVTNFKATLLYLIAYELKPLSIRWLFKNIYYADS
jgi:hypothetical protein